MFFEPSDNVVLVDRDAFDEFRRRRVLKGDKLLPGLRRFQEFRCLELTSAIVDARLLAEMRDAGLQPRPLGFLSFPPVYPPDERDEKARLGWELEAIGITQLETPKEGGEPIVVGVVDSGLDGRHAAMRAVATPADTRSVWIHRATSYVRVDAMTDLIDWTGHGTAVASVICGRQVNGRQGVEPTAKVKSATICNETLHDLHVLGALDWLCSEGVPVVNISMCTADQRDCHELILERVRQNAKALPVLAVGNYGPEWPGSALGAVSVGATDSNGQLWKGSGSHPSGSTPVAPDLVAPGAAVHVAEKGLASTYRVASATSYAAPYVSGLCAALLARCTCRPTPQQLETAILETCGRSPDPKRAKRGLPNAPEALKWLRANCGC